MAMPRRTAEEVKNDPERHVPNMPGSPHPIPNVPGGMPASPAENTREGLGAGYSEGRAVPTADRRDPILRRA